MQKLFFFLILCIISLTSLHGQISLEEKTKQADLVLEGRVISQVSKQTQDKKLIYTENEIEISKIFKGLWDRKTITIITLGGIIEDGNSQFFSHYAGLGKNQIGIFFCSLTPYQEFKNRNFNDARILFEEEGIITYSNKFSKVKAFDNHQSYKSLQAVHEAIILEARSPIIDYTNDTYIESSVKKPCDRSVPQTIFLSFQNIQMTSVLNEQFIEFDIMAKASENGLLFGKADLFINYSTLPFGASIVQNQMIEVSKEQIITDSIYSVSLSDETVNDVEISITSSGEQLNYYPMTVINEKLCHIKLQIEDLAALANLSFDDFKINGNVYYYCDRFLTPFDNVEIIGTPAILPNLVDAESITYTFENALLNNDQAGFAMSIFAASDAPTSFAGGTLLINYNSDVFGTNVESNTNLIDFAAAFGVYTIQREDFSSNTLKIEITANEPVNQEELIELNNIPKQLFRLTFTGLLDCEEPGNIDFESIAMQNLSFHYTGNSPIPNEMYDPVVADDNINEVLCGCNEGEPQITGLDNTLMTAGAGEVLTITGVNFGIYDLDESRVIFRNADSSVTSGTAGEAIAEVGDIISWQNDEVKIYVPSVTNGRKFTNSAGTGKVEVMNKCGRGESSENLHIRYALWNNRLSFANPAYPIVLGNTNENGIKFTFSTNITDNLGFIKNAFRDALEEWCAHTQIAFFIDETDSSLTTTSPNDNVNLVTIQELDTAHGQAGVIVANTYVETCVNDSQLAGYRMFDVDIRVAPSDVANVSFDDMKNYFLHELGHCHMLQHAINPNAFSLTDPTSQYAMYPDITSINFNNDNGGPNLTIKEDDENRCRNYFSEKCRCFR